MRRPSARAPRGSISEAGGALERLLACSAALRAARSVAGRLARRLRYVAGPQVRPTTQLTIAQERGLWDDPVASDTASP